MNLRVKHQTHDQEDQTSQTPKYHLVDVIYPVIHRCENVGEDKHDHQENEDAVYDIVWVLYVLLAVDDVQVGYCEHSEKSLILR